jgi:disulfide bond formation protein DsbB
VTQTRLIGLAIAGHVGLLGGAFVFQAAGYAPCAMCLWQRWPHAVAIVVGAGLLVAMTRDRTARAVRSIGALAAGGAALATAGIGAFHAGVEQGWWQGPSSCSGGEGLSGMSGADLLSTEIAEAVVMCDEIVWQVGLSMAGWNAVLSAGLAAIWVLAARRGRMTAGTLARG